MKTLYLMRHAKASRDIIGIGDIDRPLLLEGIEGTRRVVDHMIEKNIVIKHIVSSPALRAMETANIVAHGYGYSKDDILVYDELYKPDIIAFEDCIFSLADDWDHVMLVSHNPGITHFAESLVNMDEAVHTAGILSLSFPMDRWMNLYAALPIYNFFIHPKVVA
jgi:phosphohistidine phosphatase